MTAQRYHIRGKTANDISRSIEDGIRAGKLQPGEPLPSVRALAAKVDVSPVTGAWAYKALRSRGMIATGGRRGTQVAPRPPLGHHALPPVPDGARQLWDGNPAREMLPSLAPFLGADPNHSALYADVPSLTALVETVRAGLAAD